MYPKVAAYDIWKQRKDLGGSLLNPTWEMIESLIRLLDGKTRTLVTLSDKIASDNYMIVAGEIGVGFVVNVSENNDSFFSLANGCESRSKITLFIGGQDGGYESRKVVPIELALVAAHKYFAEGVRDESLKWISDY